LYGLTLARLNRCNEAVPIFQTMLSVVPDNEIAVFNANAGLDMCQAGVEEPAPETDAETDAETEAETEAELTPTPES
jgi:hypothetical protein